MYRRFHHRAETARTCAPDVRVWANFRPAVPRRAPVAVSAPPAPGDAAPSRIGPNTAKDVVFRLSADVAHFGENPIAGTIALA